MKHILILALLMVMTIQLSAQRFLVSFDRFSDNKPSYITLIDGTELIGEIKDIDRKKGLIEEITIKDESKKKHKLKPEQISHMYLPPNGISSFFSNYAFLTDVSNWDNDTYDQAHIADGYAFFEQSEVMLKKKKRPMLMQLLNPSFSSKIKVFQDPFAGETMSLGVGPLTVAGGDEKSYYVRVGDEPAFKLKKKDYRESIDVLYNQCPAVRQSVGDKPSWSDFEEHVYMTSKNCQ
ncbi:MAG: hypothetical protein K9I85_11340 [Saprospiraceae bacterium]|nr:hypothetical protein [Saprospiraceae bacterium]